MKKILTVVISLLAFALLLTACGNSSENIEDIRGIDDNGNISSSRGGSYNIDDIEDIDDDGNIIFSNDNSGVDAQTPVTTPSPEDIAEGLALYEAFYNDLMQAYSDSEAAAAPIVEEFTALLISEGVAEGEELNQYVNEEITFTHRLFHANLIQNYGDVSVFADSFNTYFGSKGIYWEDISPTERLLRHETYNRLLTMATNNGREDFYGVDESTFLDNYTFKKNFGVFVGLIENSNNDYSDNDKLLESFTDLMVWQYRCVNEYGLPYNFVDMEYDTEPRSN